MKCIIVLLCSLGAKNCFWIKMTEKLLDAGVPSAKKSPAIRRNRSKRVCGRSFRSIPAPFVRFQATKHIESELAL